MAKIKIEDIKATLEKENWQLISSTYENLDTIMEFQCPNGHHVHNSWKRMRNKLVCPNCEQNQYCQKNFKIVPKKPNVRRVLGLDQATHNCGWAIVDDQELIAYGVFTAPEGEEIERIHAVKEWFISMQNIWQPDCVALEGIQLQQGGTVVMGVTVFQTLARLQGVIMDAAYERNVEFKTCAPATWRSYNGVKGRSRVDKKRSMQNIIQKKYDIMVSDDISDAIGIGLYAASLHVIESWE